MRFNTKKLIPLLLVGISANVLADDKPWTISTGLTYRDSNFNLSGNKNNNESWSTNVNLSRKVGEKTWLGAGLSYSDSNIQYTSLNGNGNTDATSVNAFVNHYIANGLFANASLGYGKIDISNKFPTTQLKTDSDYSSASIGLMQYLPLISQLSAALSARYTHLSSNIDSFVTTSGKTVGASESTLNYVSLGGRLNYVINSFTPYVHLDWLKASREFIQNTNDDDYYSYGLGANYAFNTETNIGLSIDSVLEKRFANETSVGINLSHRF